MCMQAQDPSTTTLPLQRLQGRHRTADHTCGILQLRRPDRRSSRKAVARALHAQKPERPAEICLCTDCGAAIMLDDKQHRIRVAVPNVMGLRCGRLSGCHLPRLLDTSKATRSLTTVARSMTVSVPISSGPRRKPDVRRVSASSTSSPSLSCFGGNGWPCWSTGCRRSDDIEFTGQGWDAFALDNGGHNCLAAM